MDRKKAGYKEGFVSIIANTGLFGLKIWAGIVSGSIALSADAWHTLSDSLSSIVVIIGTKLSAKKPDQEHPFGHGRWEQIVAIFIGFLLSIIAYNFLKDSLLRLQNRQTANFGVLAIVVTVVSILLKESLAQYAFHLNKKSENLSIKADGWHHRTDALSSLLVLVGIIFAENFWWIDSALGIIIAFMLFWVTYQIIKDAINKILGEKPSQELINKIQELIKKNFQQKLFSHHFHIHNYVSTQELTFHIKVDDNMNILSAHNIATAIEILIKKELNICSTIHIEPRGFRHKDHQNDHYHLSCLTKNSDKR